MDNCDDNYLEESFNECTCKTNKKKVCLKEKGSSSRAKFTIFNDNSKDFSVTRIDHCMSIFKDIKKCDYAVKFSNEIHYIELKGSNSKEGIKQLKETLRRFSTIHSNLKRI